MEEINVAIKAAKLAGSIMLKDMNSFKSKRKGRRDIVTSVDLKCEKEIIRIIKRNFPDHNILSEETNSKVGSKEKLWVIDPLDGTGNYARGIACYSVSIAFYDENEVKAGVVYNPSTKELFTAELNKGARLNGKKISVSAVKKLKESYVIPPVWKYGHVPVVDKLIEETMGIRGFGSCAIELCYVASGRIESKIINEKPWDIAAGVLIVEEAGGKVTNFKGEKYNLFGKKMIASNGLIHDKLIKLVKER